MPQKRARARKGPKALFGIVLREQRQKHGFSQESFADRTGYHRNYIGQLERGEKSPSLTALFDFAKTLNTEASELLKLMETRMHHRQ